MKESTTMALRGPKRKCGLVLRVSTAEQAENDEGSLTNQRQRLLAKIDQMRAQGEDWEKVEIYTLRAISGSLSLDSPEMQGLRRDVIAGRVNLILCTELSRLSRSLHAFLDFYEFLKEHDTALVCLKQNIDSTSAQGLLMTQITVALAQFERGQTCERNRDTTLARCERGLWNGGAPLLGYDLPKPSELRGTLLVNEADAEIVRLAFSIYERTGSICETGKEL